MSVSEAPSVPDFQAIAAHYRYQTERSFGRKLAGLGVLFALTAFIASKTWSLVPAAGENIPPTSLYYTALQGDSLASVSRHFRPDHRPLRDDLFGGNTTDTATARSSLEMCSSSIADTLHLCDLLDSKIYSGTIVASTNKRISDAVTLREQLGQAIAVRSRAGLSLRACVEQLQEVEHKLKAEQEQTEAAVRAIKRCNRMAGCSHKVTREKATLAAPVQEHRDQVAQLRGALALDRDVLQAQSHKVDQMEKGLNLMSFTLDRGLYPSLVGSMLPVYFQKSDARALAEFYELFVTTAKCLGEEKQMEVKRRDTK